MPLRALPEYVVEDIAAFLIFLARFAPGTLAAAAPPGTFVPFLVALIGNARVVRNCYLRAKAVEALAVFSPQLNDDRGGAASFFQSVQVDPVSVAILSRSLMQFYVGACGET